MGRKNDKELRLVKKRRKGLWRIIFSRFGLIILSFIIQIYAFIDIFDILDKEVEPFSIIVMCFVAVMVLELFSCDMDSTAKLTWLFLMILLPVQISVMFWITRRRIGHRKMEKRLHTFREETKNILPLDSSATETADPGTRELCTYLNNGGCFPLYKNTDVTFFPMGENKFEAILRELRKAEKFIFMEYFIIDEGHMWGSILEILAEKAAQGVDVRVMYDGMCEISTLPFDYPKRLEALGIKAKPFSRIRPFVSTHYNYRDHRKILVIDGKTAFNGGVNLADEYINRIRRFGHWKDTAIMLRGSAVDSFTLMFLQMWNLNAPEEEWDEFLGISRPVESKGYVMPYCSNPLDKYKSGEMVYLDILNRASRYVHIMTPYLILDNELETALKYAAQRGVEVSLILPGIPDKKSAFALAKSHYRYLIDAGIKIYEYNPGFVHAKIFVSDDIKAVVGTINLDYRSLYHHFECATYLYGNDCIREIEQDFQLTLEKCRRVTYETIRKEKLSYRIGGRLLKIIAPLM